MTGWDPISYRNEIILRDGVGLGRGRGFEYSNERTVEDSDDLDLEAMARRCLEIVQVCIETGEVNSDDLVDYVPEELIEEVVKEKAEDYGYAEG